MTSSATKNILIPALVFILFIVVLLVMAFTDLFEPVIVFIHSREISTLQVIACVVGAVLGFFLVYKVLVKLGQFFLPDK